jgi:hypothetical protein
LANELWRRVLGSLFVEVAMIVSGGPKKLCRRLRRFGSVLARGAAAREKQSQASANA